MNVAAINFTAVPGNSCRGCMCEGERMSACDAANDRAVACGLPPCDVIGVEDGFIYVLALPDLVGMIEHGGKNHG